jgi:hypothetical protein
MLTNVLVVQGLILFLDPPRNERGRPATERQRERSAA